MGVPSYFGWIMRQIKRFGLHDMLHAKLGRGSKRLYLDFNCLIHRACRECKRDATPDQMISNVIRVLGEVVEHVDPSELVYISIDGSVPMGKCKQQRFRRFKSIKEAEETEAIRQRYLEFVRQSAATTPTEDANGRPMMADVDTPTEDTEKHIPFNFDFNAISPGTEFMNRLADRIRDKIDEYQLLRPRLTFMLSDSLEPGEGEHKIMCHVKQNRPAESDQIVIYGLDADLIFLTLGLHHAATYLFRENLFHEEIAGENPDYLYLNIGELYSNIVRLVVQSEDLLQLPTNIGRCDLNEMSGYRERDIITDYIFFNFFLGNDFVNRLYCMSIRDKGCETMLQIYRYCVRQCGGHLVEHNPSTGEISVNEHFLHHLLEHIAEYEEYWWHNPPKYHPPGIARDLDPLAAELEAFGRVDRYLHDIGLTMTDHDFKLKYYSRLFPLSQRHTLRENIGHVCRKYWSTVRWTLEYYLGDCPDWDWYYPYEYAPLTDDLIRHFKAINNRPFGDNGPIDVYQQLMIILPPKSFDLLPPIFRRILTNRQFSRYYPKNFDYHYYGHRFTWECPPKIPVLDSQTTRSYYEYLNRHLTREKIEAAT